MTVVFVVGFLVGGSLAVFFTYTAIERRFWLMPKDRPCRNTTRKTPNP